MKHTGPRPSWVQPAQSILTARRGCCIHNVCFTESHLFDVNADETVESASLVQNLIVLAGILQIFEFGKMFEILFDLAEVIVALIMMSIKSNNWKVLPGVHLVKAEERVKVLPPWLSDRFIIACHLFKCSQLSIQAKRFLKYLTAKHPLWHLMRLKL